MALKSQPSSDELMEIGRYEAGIPGAVLRIAPAIGDGQSESEREVSDVCR